MPPELDRVKDLEGRLFSPALLEAFRQAKDGGYSKQEAVYAAANAYMYAVEQVLNDRDQLRSLLSSQLAYLQQHRDATPAEEPNRVDVGVDTN
ncbi:hypothetical protein CKO42_09025 [Lamprobacter modestohalophilus]|uniref:Uncharacterized protein n=1 Tax=Lamprobacter modestohalophilus TaxID=1064514 RepID=A0A9X0W851_9GAMM|nr:hypothetical protein [Lamprobacter modestohalophilus]MBK1618577.1 hypothetical protein [Lamprobacter modestohalophilus]